MASRMKTLLRRWLARAMSSSAAAQPQPPHTISGRLPALSTYNSDTATPATCPWQHQPPHTGPCFCCKLTREGATLQGLQIGPMEKALQSEPHHRQVIMVPEANGHGKANRLDPWMERAGDKEPPLCPNCGEGRVSAEWRTLEAGMQADMAVARLCPSTPMRSSTCPHTAAPPLIAPLPQPLHTAGQAAGHGMRE